ncbi:MAG: hypothetical protein HY519_03320 [Candidatus Aenigmarchaeota archaeon]|nr:hypothetical protein [Candidatus Aenigmarchaeota archaeon]
MHLAEGLHRLPYDRSEPYLDRLAAALLERMGGSINGLTIKKYAGVEEQTWDQLFQLTEQRSRDSFSPVVYFPMNRQKMMDGQNNRTGYYQWLVGRVLEALEKTPISSLGEFRWLQEAYGTDFSRIYAEAPTEKQEHEPLLDPGENAGSNLGKLFDRLGISRGEVPAALVNVSVGYNHAKGLVTPEHDFVDPLEEMSEIPGIWSCPEKRDYLAYDGKQYGKGSELARDASLVCHTQASLLMPRAGHITMAVPGWALDVLSPNYGLQEWNQAGWTEGAVLERIGEKELLEV